MKSENYYWKKATEKLGVSTTGMKPINYYLKKIYDSLGGEATNKRKSNNYYVKHISDTLGICKMDYSKLESSGIKGCLIELNIPSTTTSLPVGGFSGCGNLEKVTIPSSVTSIGNGCFGYCQKIKEYQLYWTENPPTYKSGTFQIANDGKFIIPKDTTTIYESASYPSAKLEERE